MALVKINYNFLKIWKLKFQLCNIDALLNMGVREGARGLSPLAIFEGWLNPLAIFEGGWDPLALISLFICLWTYAIRKITIQLYNFFLEVIKIFIGCNLKSPFTISKCTFLILSEEPSHTRWWQNVCVCVWWGGMEGESFFILPSWKWPETL